MGLAQQAVLHQREPGVHTYALDKGGATDSVLGSWFCFSQHLAEAYLTSDVVEEKCVFCSKGNFDQRNHGWLAVSFDQSGHCLNHLIFGRQTSPEQYPIVLSSPTFLLMSFKINHTIPGF
jgi:hypothetical protein